MTSSTVTGYLADFILAENPPSITAWVPEDVCERVVAAAEIHGTARLKPVFLELNEAVSYDHIRVVLSFLQSRQVVSMSSEAKPTLFPENGTIFPRQLFSPRRVVPASIPILNGLEFGTPSLSFRGPCWLRAGATNRSGGFDFPSRSGLN